MASEPLFHRPKPRAYVGYDHKADGGYFDLAQRLFGSACDIVRDVSLERELGPEDPEAYLRAIRDEAMEGAQCAVILCGAATHLDPFVDREIKAGLDRCAGLLAIVLPGNPAGPSGSPTLPDRLQDNFDGGYAVACKWRDLADGRIDLTHRMAFAARRDPSLILNTRPLRPFAP